MPDEPQTSQSRRYVVRCRTDRPDLNDAKAGYAVVADSDEEARYLAAESFRADLHLAAAFYVPPNDKVVTEVAIDA